MDESLPGRRAISPVELLVHGGGGIRGGGGSNIVSIAINWIDHF